MKPVQVQLTHEAAQVLSLEGCARRVEEFPLELLRSEEQYSSALVPSDRS